MAKSDVKVLCGANQVSLDDVAGITVADIRSKMTEVLNITREHQIVMVNGRVISKSESEVRLSGGEEVEFKKPAGQKG